MPEQDSTAKPPPPAIQRSAVTTLPPGGNYVGVTTYATELYAAHYPDLGTIAVHMNRTTISFTPSQWSTVFAAVASVSPRTVTA